MTPVLVLAATLVWEVTAPAEVTTADAIDVRVALVNRGAAPATWSPQHPTAVLVPRRGPVRRRQLFDALQWSGSGQPGPGEPAYATHFDLRRLFGRLPPGAYELRVGGARARFTVAATTLADAERANPRQPGFSLALDPPVIVDRVWKRYETATLDNRSGSAMSFKAYTGDRTPGQPLMATTSWERWHPTLGWRSPGPLGWCGTGLGVQTVPDGSNERLQLAHTSFADGIYRFVLEADAGGTPVRVTSEAFQLDHLANYGSP